MRMAGVLAELAQRLALPEQVPALVELPLDPRPMGLALLGGLGVDGQCLLLAHQRSDLGENVVIHAASIPLPKRAPAAGPCPSRGRPMTTSAPLRLIRRWRTRVAVAAAAT